MEQHPKKSYIAVECILALKIKWEKREKLTLWVSFFG